jgi:hypothetical protein
MYMPTPAEKVKRAILCRNRGIAYMQLVELFGAIGKQLRFLTLCEVYLNFLIFACHITVAYSFKHTIECGLD